jgi:plastocyanin
MIKQSLIKLALCGAVAVVLAACGSAGAQSREPAAADNGTGNSVHMGNTEFLPPSVTIAKDTSITLVADTFVPHFIANGTWENGSAKPARESGAPEVTDMHIDGNGSGAIGPFSAAGTFQLYCTIHPGMNLAVVVE